MNFSYLQSIILFSFCFLFKTISAQEKVYFDKIGNQSNAENSFYYRVNLGNNSYKSYYTSNEAIFFEGKITNADNQTEKTNLYLGECVWYYKNGNIKYTATYNVNGQENGTAKEFYENGNKFREIEFSNGKIISNIEYSIEGTVFNITEERFYNNFNDWDLYSSKNGSAKIENKVFHLQSFTKQGIARYINFLENTNEYTLEIDLDFSSTQNDDSKVGLIYGFKDWNNYNFFLITKNNNISIGSVVEGVLINTVSDLYCSVISAKKNTLKIISVNGKDIFSINGEIQYKTNKLYFYGTKLGVAVEGVNSIKVERIVFKTIDKSKGERVKTNLGDEDIKSTGSGILISNKGYIITNYHVVENAKNIIIETNINGVNKNYSAVVVQKDKENDLAIVKIEEFDQLNLSIDYEFSETGRVEVGNSVFTIGFPLALSGMGKDPKFVDGKISSKTGYNNSLNSYQTSVPVQPGNSGGPLFNNKGELVGVINAKIHNADNVSYAIKVNYIKNLIDLLPESISYPKNTKLQNQSLENQFKVLSNYVVLIKCK